MITMHDHNTYELIGVHARLIDGFPPGLVNNVKDRLTGIEQL